ncbi:MAG: lipoyl-dependent peroxiredoxin [Gaiellales bacterium]|nr:lipoyl-dependent peroxiredoxin [Gaiellales bacterium]
MIGHSEKGLLVDSLDASATLRWNGFRGRIEGASSALSVATATQAELGGPGGESNPEELFSAALANCFTSTLTSMARSRGIELGDIETSVTTRLAWGDGESHHLTRADMRTRIASPAPREDVLELVEEAERHCPVCQLLAGKAELHVLAEVVPS